MLDERRGSIPEVIVSQESRRVKEQTAQVDESVYDRFQPLSPEDRLKSPKLRT